jgi:hypothetical protein
VQFARLGEPALNDAVPEVSTTLALLHARRRASVDASPKPLRRSHAPEDVPTAWRGIEMNE